MPVLPSTVLKKIEDWIRPEIRALSAYHVPDSRGLIKLDAMENPYRWPEELRKEWAALLQEVDVNRYPHPQAPELTRQLKKSLQLSDDMELLLGNGSDEIIQIIAMAMAAPGRTLLSVEPGFVMYQMIAKFCGMNYVGVPLQATDFSLDMPALLEAIEASQPAVIFLAYPNNPTGNLFDEADIIRVIEVAPGLVVIDEAYEPFADASFMPKLGAYDNLVVMRTLSKMGLAGLRLGLLAGSKAWLDEFDKVRLPYNINVLTQVTAEFAIRHQTIFDQQTFMIRTQRMEMFETLQNLPQVQVFPSQANFVLIRTPAGSGKHIFQSLKQRGILIKCLDGSNPLLKDCLRLTVGTDEENQILLTELQSILSFGD